jgi:hypothetical protein
MPMVVISHSRTAPNPFGFPTAFPVRALNQAFNVSQAQLATLVRGSRHVIARRSGHAIGFDHPNLVIAAIWSVVDQARRVDRGSRHWPAGPARRSSRGSPPAGPCPCPVRDDSSILPRQADEAKRAEGNDGIAAARSRTRDNQ